jgi:hypothetical protein
MDSPGFPIESCTLASCSLKNAQVQYDPSLGGNAFYVSIFALAIFVQALLGIQYRTWSFLAGMFCGLILETVGYAARIQMHFNPFTKGPFVMLVLDCILFDSPVNTNDNFRYLVALTIGPTFFTASIYLCLARIIVVFGEHLSRFKPRTYTVSFITSDVISLLLQAVGGAIASGADTYEKKQHGIHIMVAGLAFQVASLVIFMLLCADFARAVRAGPRSTEPMFFTLRSSLRFKAFLWCKFQPFYPQSRNPFSKSFVRSDH